MARGRGFALDRHRVNITIFLAQCLAVGELRIVDISPASLDEMTPVNLGLQTVRAA